MTSQRIINIVLDDKTIIWRSADIEQERRIAIFDLLEGNSFAPASTGEDEGPWRVTLRAQDGRLGIEIAREDGTHLITYVLAMGRFRRPIRDYFAICDSYFQAIKDAPPAQIETIDMARRAIHDSAARLLQDALAGKVAVDFDTARRLFTLICVLHIKG